MLTSKRKLTPQLRHCQRSREPVMKADRIPHQHQHQHQHQHHSSGIKAIGMLCLLLLAACNSSNNSDNANILSTEPTSPSTQLTGCADTDSCFSNPNLQIGGDRLAQVQIPSNYTTTTRYPLLILLHGFGVNGAVQSIYLGLDTRVDSQQYVLVTPDGTENASGLRFWNATPGCCAPEDEAFQVDDVAYIRSLIEEAADTYSIDASRIGLIGHSNGGFMALRLACEASDLVTSVVSLAGSTFDNDASCTPTTYPVSVLTIHGDEDETIPYTGSRPGRPPFPSAEETTRRFAAHAGCNNTPVMAPNLDVLGAVEGVETTVLEYNDCAAGTDVTLWTLVGGPHIPFPWVASSLDLMVDWIIDHRRDPESSE
jgi:polyhydroxybutyrate depolymerase